jgi:hypothetical protein
MMRIGACSFSTVYNVKEDYFFGNPHISCIYNDNNNSNNNFNFRNKV